MFRGLQKIWNGQLRVMEPEHLAAEVPSEIVESQLTPAEIQLKSSILKKLDWVSGRYVTNFVAAEEMLDLVTDLVENDHAISAMLSEPGGKLVVELVTRCALRLPKVRAWASLRGFMSMEGIQFVDIMPYLGILVRKDHKANALLAGLIRVVFFFTIWDGKLSSSTRNGV